jgi:hypothetical protein
MKRLFVLFLMCGMILMVTSVAPAKEKAAIKPGAVVADVVTLEATVESIDYQKRTVTLKGPEGTTKTLTVGKEVKNFDQIKKGDKVKADFLEEVALFIRKPTESPVGVESGVVGVAPKGKMPGMFNVNTVEITANVESIDYKKRTVTLRGPEGNLTTFKVDKRVKRFKEVKKGDQVVLRYTEAYAINVTRP